MNINLQLIIFKFIFFIRTNLNWHSTAIETVNNVEFVNSFKRQFGILMIMIIVMKRPLKQFSVIIQYCFLLILSPYAFFTFLWCCYFRLLSFLLSDSHIVKVWDFNVIRTRLQRLVGTWLDRHYYTFIFASIFVIVIFHVLNSRSLVHLLINLL